MCPPRGSTYALKGQTPVLEVADSKHYAHLSVSVHITSEGALNYEVRSSSFNGVAMVRFLKKTFTGRKRKKHLMIWDRATIHTCQAVKDFLEQEAANQQRVWLEVLPPYSPELNPTELLWAYLKKHKLANMACKTLQELRQKTIVALEDIKEDKQLIKAFFKHPKVGLM